MTVIRFARIIIALLILLSFSFLSGCDCNEEEDDEKEDDSDDDDDNDDNDVTDDDNDDNDSGPDVDDLIAEGKDWLAFPEGDKARLSFLAALDIIPDHPEAMYGLVLSDLVHTTDVLSILVDYVMSVIEYGGPVKDNPSGEDLVNGIIQRVIDGLLRDRVAELIDYADRTIQAEGEFDHEGIPIFIHYEQVAELSVEFDYPELHASTALSGLLAGLIYHLYAVDLDFDITHVFRIADLDFDAMSTTEIVSAIVEILLDMFTDPGYPDFFTMPDDNAEIFKQAGMEMGDGFDAWTRVFPAIRTETDDQTDDVMGYVDLNANSAFDPSEPYFIPHYGELNPDQMELLQAVEELVAGLRDSFYDYTKKDVDPYNPNPFQLVLLRPIVAYAGLPRFLIPNWEIDIGAWYVDPAGSGLRDTLVAILSVMDLFLPDYHW